MDDRFAVARMLVVAGPITTFAAVWLARSIAIRSPMTFGDALGMLYRKMMRGDLC